MEAAEKNKWTFTITVFTAVVSMALFLAGVYYHWFGADVGVGDVFCEGPYPGLIKQPVNTWSNLGFVTAGLIMGWQLTKGVFKSNRNSLTGTNFFGAFFASLAVLLGPGSMALHATMSDVGGFFDMLSMYLVASFTTAYSAQRFFNWKPWQFLLLFTASLSVCLWADNKPYHIIFDYFGNTTFAFFISLTILFEILNTYVRKMQHQKKWGLIAIGSLLTALGVWNVSQTGQFFCNPWSLIQGHAIWHLLDALAVYGLFRFYVSEHKEPSPVVFAR